MRDTLFLTLRQVAEGKVAMCPNCGQSRHLRLKFERALDSASGDCRVLAAFLPREPVRWTKDGSNVEFFPFLVITEESRHSHVWLPYWHVVERAGKKNQRYGQWAPYMEEKLLDDLLEQAREQGFFRPPDAPSISYIGSPRLAHPEQAADFEKEVVEEGSD